MDLSKLKVDVYDFLALIIPGLLAFAEIGISISGWSTFFARVAALSGTALTLILMLAFAGGHVIQEVSDAILKRIRGPRFFKGSRDAFWKTPEASSVKERIFGESGARLEAVDSAFEYCLAKVQVTFPKRDVFLATSDLCRALALLLLFSLVPLWRTVYCFNANLLHKHVLFGLLTVLFALLSWMSWRRMVRFREFTDAPVFRSYLALPESVTLNQTVAQKAK